MTCAAASLTIAFPAPLRSCARLFPAKGLPESSRKVAPSTKGNVPDSTGRHLSSRQNSQSASRQKPLVGRGHSESPSGSEQSDRCPSPTCDPRHATGTDRPSAFANGPTAPSRPMCREKSSRPASDHPDSPPSHPVLGTSSIQPMPDRPASDRSSRSPRSSWSAATPSSRSADSGSLGVLREPSAFPNEQSASIAPSPVGRPSARSPDPSLRST